MSTATKTTTTQTFSTHQNLAQALGVSSQELDRIYSTSLRLYEQARFSEAHCLLQLCVICDHHSKSGWLALAACRQMLGEFMLAAESYVQAAGLDVQDPAPAIQAVFCLLRAGDPDSARVWLQEAERRAAEGDNAGPFQAKCRVLKAAIDRARSTAIG